MKNRKIIAALLMALIFTFSLIPMAFADGEDAAPAVESAAAPAAAAPAAATSGGESSSAAVSAPAADTSSASDAAPVTESASDSAAADSSSDNAPAAETPSEQTDASGDNSASAADDTADTSSEETADSADPAEESEDDEEQDDKASDNSSDFASLYTVEFVNPADGSEITIVGGSDVYFSVLNSELGLGVEIDEVASIDSSNDELFTAEKVDGDYVIHTFQPFTSAEQLLINLIDSGVISVDVFDADYSTDEGFQAIVDSFTNDTAMVVLSTGQQYIEGKVMAWEVPTREGVIKIQYLGQTWDVIGFNGKGIKAGADEMTLLLDGLVVDKDGYVVETKYKSMYEENYNNDYSDSILRTVIENFLTEITSGQDEDIVGLLEDMMLFGGQDYYENEPYCDGIAGETVTTKIRPLTTQEAMILTNFTEDSDEEAFLKNCLTTVSTDYEYLYWLASPGYAWPYGDIATVSVKEWDGFVLRDGSNSDKHEYGVRPVIMLNLKDKNVVTYLIDEEQRLYGLKFADDPEPSPEPGPGAGGSAAQANRRIWVYVDGNLIDEADYICYTGITILTDEFLSTLASGSHSITVLYTGTYGETLPADFDYNSSNTYAIEI